MQPFSLTVLEARGKRLTKIYTADGRKISFDRAKEFRVHCLEADGFDDMVHHIAALEHVPGCCLIRGTPLPWCPTDGTARRLLKDRPGYANQNGRLFSIEEVERNGWQKRIDVDLFPVSILPTFEDGPSYLVPFDFDGIEHEHDWREHLEETADWLKLRLPDEFADASCFYQATSSAADPTKPDLGGPFVRMRLFFWLSRPLTGAQLKAWIPDQPGLDKAIFGAVQPIYVARPLFSGCPDPMRERSGVLRGLQDVVDVPDDLPAPAARPAPRGSVWALGSDCGLLECDAFEEALGEITGAGGEVRSGLRRAAGRYVWHVGAENVDVDALTQRLAEEALHHRSQSEVEGYNLRSMVRWIMEQQPRDNPAADFIAKITAELHAGAGEDEEAEPEPVAEPEGQDGPQALPDFLPVRADRDAALQEMHDAIANTVAEAWAGAEIRDELELEDEIARREVEERMLAELGVDTTEGLTDRQKRKLSREKTKAAKAAKAAVLERYGRDHEPRSGVDLFNGLQGGGKTAAVIRKLARRPTGADLVVVPTTGKAEEIAEALRKEGVKRKIFVLRGRTKEKEGEPKGGARMCGQDPELIERAQTQGINVRMEICKFCPLRGGAITSSKPRRSGKPLTG